LSKEQQDANWFSAPSALRVYGEISCLACFLNGLSYFLEKVPEFIKREGNLFEGWNE